MEQRYIRNSTAEFLIFAVEGKEDGIHVLYRDESIGCTQNAMGTTNFPDSRNIGRRCKRFAS